MNGKPASEMLWRSGGPYQSGSDRSVSTRIVAHSVAGLSVDHDVALHAGRWRRDGRGGGRQRRGRRRLVTPAPAGQAGQVEDAEHGEHEQRGGRRPPQPVHVGGLAAPAGPVRDHRDRERRQPSSTAPTRRALVRAPCLRRSPTSHHSAPANGVGKRRGGRRRADGRRSPTAEPSSAPHRRQRATAAVMAISVLLLAAGLLLDQQRKARVPIRL